MLNDYDKFTLYRELSKLSGAGFPIHKSIESILDTNPPKKQANYLQQTLKGIEEKKSFSDSVQNNKSITSLEISLISSGEKSGKIPEILSLLSNYFKLQYDSKKKIRAGLIYPIVMLHFAILLPALPRAAASRDLVGELMISLITLFVCYFILVIGIFLVRHFLKKAQHVASYDKLFNRLPSINKVRRAFALSRFTEILRIYLISSHTVSDSLKAASEASLSGEIVESMSREVLPSVSSGNPAGPILASLTKIFPPTFTRSYITSEESGTLDIELAQWSKIFSDDAESQCNRMSKMVPKVTYGFVVIIVIWQIFKIFGGYLEIFDRLNSY